MRREYYSDTIAIFMDRSSDEILGELVRSSNLDGATLERTQSEAWIEQIRILSYWNRRRGNKGPNTGSFDSAQEGARGRFTSSTRFHVWDGGSVANRVIGSSGDRVIG